MAAYQNKTQFPPSVSLSHQETFISLLSFSIRGHTDWKPQSQKTNQSNHMDHSLSNSMKLPFVMVYYCFKKLSFRSTYYEFLFKFMGDISFISHNVLI